MADRAHQGAAGRAQILVVPDLEAGNMLAKNLTFLAGAEAAGIVVGARVPIVLASRSDSIRPVSPPAPSQRFIRSRARPYPANSCSQPQTVLFA